MMDHSRSDLERGLFDIKENSSAVAVFGKEIVSLEGIVKRYQRVTESHTNTTAVGKALIRVGVREKRRITTPGGRPWVCALCRPEYWKLQDNEAWAAEYLRGLPEPLELLRAP
jgi:hypothetical protein